MYVSDLRESYSDGEVALLSLTVLFFIFSIQQKEKGYKVKVLESTHQIRGLHTIIRNKDTSRADFVFYSDRLIRLLIEEGNW
tara:strand:- start:238 stop:483 length:246 start_codon:yes stop_codon:yes gene_type:complete